MLNRTTWVAVLILPQTEHQHNQPSQTSQVGDRWAACYFHCCKAYVGTCITIGIVGYFTFCTMLNMLYLLWKCYWAKRYHEKILLEKPFKIHLRILERKQVCRIVENCFSHQIIFKNLFSMDLAQNFDIPQQFVPHTCKNTNRHVLQQALLRCLIDFHIYQGRNK